MNEINRMTRKAWLFGAITLWLEVTAILWSGMHPLMLTAPYLHWPGWVALFLMAGYSVNLTIDVWLARRRQAQLLRMMGRDVRGMWWFFRAGWRAVAEFFVNLWKALVPLLIQVWDALVDGTRALTRRVRAGRVVK